MWDMLLAFNISFTLCETFYLTFILESFAASDVVQAPSRTFVEVSAKRILTRIIIEVEVEERKKERKKNARVTV